MQPTVTTRGSTPREPGSTPDLVCMLIQYVGRPGWHSSSRNPPLMAGVVRTGLSEWAIPPLDQARVATIKSGPLFAVGLQDVRTGRNYQSFRQAWWCCVVGGASSSGGHRNSTDRSTQIRAFGETADC